MNDHKLPKNEKLCSRTAIDRLFAEGSSFIVYPIRVVYRIDDSESAPPRFFINIPKRNFKRAVKRVYLRRRIREAYRLNKQILTEPLSRQSRTAHLAFLYLDKNLNDFHFIEKKVVEILERLARKIESQQTPSLRHEKTAIGHTPASYPFLQGMYFPHATSIVPICTHLFAICYRCHTDTWPVKRFVADRQTYPELSPVGW